MLTLEGSTLVFRFPQVHEEAVARIEFQRTLRVPNDGKVYPLPPGLGRLPLEHVEDFEGFLPAEWGERGGAFMPLHRAEAMWISFPGDGNDYPFAIKIAAGKINAISGMPWDPGLANTVRDYLVIPGQPWLDGYRTDLNEVRQFVAMPLGAGYSAEEQLTGEACHGGLQIIAYPMLAEYYERMTPYVSDDRARACGSMGRRSSKRRGMGLAAGGRISQQVFVDSYGLDAWDQDHFARCFVTLMDASDWREVTGHAPGARPPTAKNYNNAGLPWFSYYAEGPVIGGAPRLAALKTVGDQTQRARAGTIPSDDAIEPHHIVKLRPRIRTGRRVKQSDW